MTITVGYGFDYGTVGSFHAPPFTDVDLTSLSNGGYAAVGIHTDHTDLYSFDDTNANTGSTYGAIYSSAVNTAISELHNGNIVNVMSEGGDVDFATVSAAGGGIVHGEDTLGFTPTFGTAHASFVDVAGLHGSGFVVALQNDFSVTDGDIYALMSNDDGSSVTQIAVDATNKNDDRPSVAVLNDGGFAVAWTRTLSDSSTAVRYKVYNSDGSVRTPETLLDNYGTINRDVDVVALKDGGFGIVYEDNGWTFGGNTEITFVDLDADGNFLGDYTRVSNTSVDDGEASATLMSNGMVAVSYTHNYSGGDHDIYMQIVDPDTDSILGSSAAIDGDTNFAHDSSSAGMDGGRIAVGWSDDTEGQQNRIMTVVRTTVGDNAANVLAGDSLRDVMYGGKAADTLNGGAGDDSLYGGKGKDTFHGGIGADYMQGDAGKDTVSYADTGSVEAFLALPASNTGDAAGDTYLTIENLIGSAFADTLEGTDGKNSLSGGGGIDFLFGLGGVDDLKGGLGADTLNGGDDGDTMNGGGGADNYICLVSESTGPNYDTLVGFDADEDRIGVKSVTGIDTTVGSGALSSATFNADLGAAIDGAHLAKNHAVIFTPTTGTLAGQTFLIVEANNHAGYQSGQDMVVDLSGVLHLNHLDTTDFFTPV